MNIPELINYASELILNLTQDEMHNFRQALSLSKISFNQEKYKELIYLKTYIVGCLFFEARKPVKGASVSRERLDESAMMLFSPVLDIVEKKLNEDTEGIYWGASTEELTKVMEYYPRLCSVLDIEATAEVFMERIADKEALTYIVNDSNLKETFNGIVRNTDNVLSLKFQDFQAESKPGFFDYVKYLFR